MYVVAICIMQELVFLLLQRRRMQYHAHFVTEAGTHPKASTRLHQSLEHEYRLHVANTPVAHLTLPKVASRLTGARDSCNTLVKPHKEQPGGGLQVAYMSSGHHHAVQSGPPIQGKTAHYTVGAANPHFLKSVEAFAEVPFSLIFNLEGLDHGQSSSRPNSAVSEQSNQQYFPTR